MPVINGRIHLRRRRLQPHHWAAYIASVAAAVLLVVVGWTVTVGRQLNDFMTGVQETVTSASRTVSQARTPAPASPADYVPALHAALQAQQAGKK